MNHSAPVSLGAAPATYRAWILVPVTLPFFAGTALYHLPIGLMALAGTWEILRDRRALGNDPAFRILLAFFLCLWLPQLMALPTAVDSSGSLEVAVRYLLYLPAAYFIARAVRSDPSFMGTGLVAAFVIGVWGADMVAGAAGLRFGPPPEPDDYVGGALFGRHSLAHVAAAASPFVFEVVRRRHREAPWLWIAPVLLALLVVLSGRRVAWMMLLLSGGAYLGYLRFVAGGARRRLVVLVPAVLVAVSVGAGTLHPPTAERALYTMELVSSDREVVDRATSWRLDIWRTAVETARGEWPLGAGARGFRHVYEAYAEPDDFWLQEDRSGALHPHQFTLEVAAETGIAGLLGYALAWGILGFIVVRSGAGWVWPAALATGIALFPLNAHLALYGSYWSALTWWAIGLLAGARAAAGSDAPPPG